MAPWQVFGAQISVTDVRFWSLGDVTRVAIQTTGQFRYKSGRLSNPDRVYYDIENSRQRVSETTEHAIAVDDGLIHRIRLAQNRQTVTRIVIDLGNDVTVSASQLSNPDRLVVEVRRNELAPSLSKERKLEPPKQAAGVKSRKEAPLAEDPPKQAAATASPPEEEMAKQRDAAPSPELIEKPVAEPLTATADTADATPPEDSPETASVPPASSEPEQTAAQPPAGDEPEQTAAAASPEPELIARPAQGNSAGGHSLTRVLGLKLGRVVIDPGHGGRDTGTIGPTGLQEKEVTLDVAQRLAKLIEQRMGSKVILTRDGDTSVKLRERTAKANSVQADLFISIHVNASRYRTVNGVETFYLNFTRSRADLEVAARENAGSDMPMHELSNLVQKIALDDKIQESRDLASVVQNSVYEVHRKHFAKARNRGVKKAPFLVLIGAQMPSILVELGFISNPQEEKLMKQASYREALADSLFDGVSKYAQSLSHFQVAQASDGEDGEDE